MKKVLAVLLLFIASPMAFANSCPKVMKEIDAKMSSAKGIDGAKMAKIKALRAEGEKMHKEGKHDESMKALGEAKKMLEG